MCATCDRLICAVGGSRCAIERLPIHVTIDRSRDNRSLSLTFSKTYSALLRCAIDRVAPINGKGGATIVIGRDNVPPILMSAGDRGYKSIR